MPAVPSSIVTAAQKAAAAEVPSAILPTVPTVDVATQQPSGPSPMLIVIPFAAVSVIGLWWFMHRKKRRK